MTSYLTAKIEAVLPKVAKFLQVSLGYIVFGAWFFFQRHEAHIKSGATMTIYYADKTEEALHQMESSQRGYLFTSDPDMYEDFTNALRDYTQYSSDFRNALDPEYASRLSTVLVVADAKIKEMRMTLDLANSGHLEDAKKLVLTHQGQRYMAEIRTEISQIRSTAEIRAIASMSSF